MKILIAMASIASEKGGPSNAVHFMASALAENGHDVTVISSFSHGESTSRALGGYELLSFPVDWASWEFSRGYKKWLLENINKFDHIILHSLFRHHSQLVARLSKRHGISYSIRPHGSLNDEDLKHRRRLKLIYLRTVEKLTLAECAFVFCTSEAEADDAKKWVSAPTFVIPLGVDPRIFSLVRNVDRQNVLFLSRIAAKKGLDLLLEAQSLLKKREVASTLTIAGTSSGGLAGKMKALALKLDILKSVNFVGHVDENGKFQAFTKAGVFVLPSADENFGISVAEAMAAGIPVIITTGVSHAKLVAERRAGLVVQRDATAIAQAIQSIVSLSTEEYNKVAEAGRKLAIEMYSWKNTAKRIEDVIFTFAKVNLGEINDRRDFGDFDI